VIRTSRTRALLLWWAVRAYESGLSCI
jgi:hypothetical protein